MYTTQNIDKEKFEENLLLSQIYCDLQLQNSDGHIAAILRSYNPIYNGTNLFSYEYSPKQGRCNAFFAAICSASLLRGSKQIYADLFFKQLQHKGQTQLVNIYNKEVKGRILIAEIDQTIIDGASEVASEGFIDGNDCPPIDTWFYKSTDSEGWQILYAWIPEQFISLVQDAIDVNCVECLLWYEDYILNKTTEPVLATTPVKAPNWQRKSKRFINWIKGR